jgi:DNA-binding SARP family transcriptional activator
MAILFAATYPERVESLILYGTGATLVADLTPSELDAVRERQRAFAAIWGTDESAVVDRFAPSLAGDDEFRVWHQRYERHAASTESLLELLELSLEMDVREVLPSLDVPTLVVHRTGDQVIPVAYGRELAAQIPGARLVEQEGDDHFSYAGDVDAWMDEVERFVTGTVAVRPSEPPHSVRINTLGRFAVLVEGDEVPTSAWGSRRARQLCKRLVAARGWPVTRDELIDMLWPDEFDPQRLSARLSVQLSAVRRVLGGGVVADRQSVRLDLDAVATDLEDFHAAEADGDIVAAYHGEFLAEDRYEDWAISSRDEARTRFVAAARRLAESAGAAGDHQRSAELARRLIAADRYDESAHRLLVAALLAAGEPGEARRAHGRWAEAMDELDVEIASFDEVAGS